MAPTAVAVINAMVDSGPTESWFDEPRMAYRQRSDDCPKADNGRQAGHFGVSHHAGIGTTAQPTLRWGSLALTTELVQLYIGRDSLRPLQVVCQFRQSTALQVSSRFQVRK